MLRHERSAPVWLFSFVDLAFLLLIAFTQIDANQVAEQLDLSQVEIPQIYGDGTPIESSTSIESWQLRIHALPHPSARDKNPQPRTPFALIEPGTDGHTVAQIDATDLAAQLALLANRAQQKPIVAPHRDARAEDLLIAVALLDESWQNARSVAVRPGPDVAAPPMATKNSEDSSN